MARIVVPQGIHVKTRQSPEKFLICVPRGYTITPVKRKSTHGHAFPLSGYALPLLRWAYHWMGKGPLRQPPAEMQGMPLDVRRHPRTSSGRHAARYGQGGTLLEAPYRGI
jgi:hypothetical protein